MGLRSLLFMAAICLPFLSCGGGGAGVNGGSGAPPGTPCGSFTDGGASIPSLATHQCAQNPSLLASCWMCVSFVGLDAGAPAACELPCRLGHDADCPSGQHCLSPDQAPANGETSSGCAYDYPNDAFGYCG
jgi:hypothetical protein